VRVSTNLEEERGPRSGQKLVAFSADGGRVATGSEDRTARLWAAASGTCVAVLAGHAGDVSSVSFAADGTLATASEDRTVRFWDAATGALASVLEAHAGEVNACAFSADSARIVTGSKDRTARVFDARAVLRRGTTARAARAAGTDPDRDDPAWTGEVTGDGLDHSDSDSDSDGAPATKKSPPKRFSLLRRGA